MKHIPNIIFLRYFLSACQSKSISKAAKDNLVSQSAISQAINKLEISLGKQLITHEKNRFLLTPDGQLLMEKSGQIFSVLSEINDAFDESEGLFKGKLTFACTHSFALSFLPAYLGKLSQMWPDVEPVLRFGHTGMIMEWVKKREIDFGIVLDNDDFSAFQIQEIYRGKYGLYAAKKLPKNAPQRFLISEERREVSLLREHLSRLDINMDSIMEISSWEVIAKLAESGLGIGFLPDYIVKNHQLVPFKCGIPAMPYRILAIFPKSVKPGRNAKMFIDLIKN